ncbi:MAG: CHASE2 domain-containing protein [Fibrobacteraceae bacterium]|nr:CHASE2 domain-containing protein [Fibrobacteraceae bacterium]
MKIKISKKIKKPIVGVTASSVIVVLILIFGSTQNSIHGVTRNGAEAMENIFYDLFYKTITGKGEVEDRSDDKVTINEDFDPNIKVVDIDERSLQKYGNYNEWDRSVHANVVKHLGGGGAAAIGFDIMFKGADFGKERAQNAIELLANLSKDSIDFSPLPYEALQYIKEVLVEQNQDSLLKVIPQYLKKSMPRLSNIKKDTALYKTLLPKIQTFYNYDSMLVKAVKENGNVISCMMFDNTDSYKHETEWKPLSDWNRGNSISYSSTLENSQIDKIENVESKDLLDNIFPELARASKFYGSVNAYPDDDGVMRRVKMLYQFPNTKLYPDAPTKVYTTMPLMMVLHLFHQKPENVRVKMGEYIELGKPFGVYRDSSTGEFLTTYPQFSYPMFLALKEKLKEIKGNEVYNEIIDISNTVIAKKDKDNQIYFEIFEGQELTVPVSDMLRRMDEKLFDSLKNDDETIEIEEGFTLKNDPSDDAHDKKRFIITDTEEEEEYTITPYVIKTIRYFADSLDKIKPDNPVHLSLDMDIRLDAATKKWYSSLIILSDSVIKEIQKTPDSLITALKPGEEHRFGPIKRIPINKAGQMQINYTGRYNTTNQFRAFEHISYYDVAESRIDATAYQGKIFILGSAAPALFDFVSGPQEEHYPGVLIHATVIQNILRDHYMVTLEERFQKYGIILLAIVCVLLGLYLKGYISISISVLVMVIYTFIAYQYFKSGIYIGVSKQLFTILLTSLSSFLVQFYFENKEKSFLNNAFKQYISPELIDEMVNNEIMPTLGGEKSNITAYFTDIASFSTFSEKIGDPSKLVELLNEYLTSMTDTLLHNKGTLDKYEGDAIIAFFGAPMPLENHAQSACTTAVDMQNKLMRLRKKWASEENKWPKVVHDMHMRIGINSGDIVTGNMGSTMRKNYTMMGDAVNLAARLESAAKQYGAYIQISEDTEKKLIPDTFIYRSLDTIRVIGKSLPVKTYELLEKTGCKEEDSLKILVSTWEKARSHYLNMEWDKAIELFTQCLDFEPHHPDRDPGSKTTPSHVYIKRCTAYKENPPVAPGEVWDGVFTATEK